VAAAMGLMAAPAAEVVGRVMEVGSRVEQAVVMGSRVQPAGVNTPVAVAVAEEAMDMLVWVVMDTVVATVDIMVAAAAAAMEVVVVAMAAIVVGEVVRNIALVEGFLVCKLLVEEKETKALVFGQKGCQGK